MQRVRTSATHRRLPRRAVRGFTLLELLVAVVVLAIVMLLALNALRFGSRSWELQQNRSTEVTGVRVVRDYLRRQLALTVPHYADDIVRDRLVFDGGPDSLRFVASMSRGRRDAGRYLISLLPQRGPGGNELVVEYGLIDPGAERLRVLPGERTVLLRNLQAMQISYFGSARPREHERWRSVWPPDAEQLPRLLRLQIQLAEREIALELAVALPLRAAFDEPREDS